jgi:DNA-binding MarR family transcriptional regulator
MITSTPQGAALTDLIVEVFRLNGLLLEAGDLLTHPLGLTSARWQVLGVVEHAPISVAHVARTMNLARQSVQQTADGLEVDGFITYVDNPHHRRSKLMQLTPKGRAALDAVWPRRAAWADAVAAGLAPDDLRAALELLQALGVRVGASLGQLRQPGE